MVTLVVGSQWGDEGKGKIVDLLSENSNYVVRFHGGNNAGHTVIANGKKYPFHLMPSGILHKKAIGVIANGTIIDLEVLISEIEMLQKDGVSLLGKLFISDRCHIILPYHKSLDEAYENARGKNKLGTTKRGIGPALADKVSYNGIRLYELYHWEEFEKKFLFQTRIKNHILNTFKVKLISPVKELKKIRALREKILPFVADTYQIMQKAMKQKKNILMEGAHGVMLDNDFSPYPFATGSNVITGAVNTGSGIPVQKIERVVSVVKAYTSRVGSGPLPTELFDKTAEYIREKGAEFGTTTGRARRVGWLDLVAVKFAIEVTGTTEIALTKSDVLSGLKKIKVCIGYQLNKKNVSYSGCGYLELEKLKPVYKIFDGWIEDILDIKSFKDLPKNLKIYLEFIEKFLGAKVSIISTGPTREEVIFK